MSFLFKFFTFVAFLSGRIKCSKKCRVVRLCRWFIPWQQVGTIPLSGTCFLPWLFVFLFLSLSFNLVERQVGAPITVPLPTSWGHLLLGPFFLTSGEDNRRAGCVLSYCKTGFCRPITRNFVERDGILVPREQHGRLLSFSGVER